MGYMFKNRVDAGIKLAEMLRAGYENSNAVTIAIPRGGVVVGEVIARILHIPLDVIIPRKIGVPGNPELAIGSVTENNIIVNEQLVQEIGISREYIEAEADRERQEIARRRKLYLGERKPLDLRDRIAIIADDGLATGFTALAAITAVRDFGPLKIVLAVPVAPTEAYDRLKKEVDELVCIQIETVFFAVGQFYETFEQTTDSEVVDILSRYHEEK
jgi:putative phosphoribosyl transferase